MLSKPWFGVDPEHIEAVASDTIKTMQRLEDDAGWQYLKAAMATECERRRDELEISDITDDFHRGYLKALRDIHAFPTKLTEQAGEIINPGSDE